MATFGVTTRTYEESSGGTEVVATLSRTFAEIEPIIYFGESRYWRQEYSAESSHHVFLLVHTHLSL